MGNGYNTSYQSLGPRRRINLDAPVIEIITGRGTRSRRLGKGSMACMLHIVYRLLVGKDSTPYRGAQEIPIFGFSPAGLRLLERIAVEVHRARVRIINQINCNLIIIN